MPDTTTSNPFSELDHMEEYEQENVGLRPEDKKYARSADQEWFKGDQGATYRVSLVYFWPLVITTALAAQRRAKEKGEQVSKEQQIELAKKALAKRSEELNKPLDQLADWEKLDLSETRFKKILAHYKEGFGFVNSRLGKDGADADEIWKMLGDQKSYFCTILMIYPTNRSGELDREEVTKKYRIMPWRLSSKVYGQLHGQASSLRANELSISDQDLLITCTNGEYQNFDKMEGAGKALWRKNPKFMSIILEKSFAFYEKLTPFRNMSTADLKIKLGVSSGEKGGDDDVSSDDVEDLLNNV